MADKNKSLPSPPMGWSNRKSYKYYNDKMKQYDKEGGPSDVRRLTKSASGVLVGKDKLNKLSMEAEQKYNLRNQRPQPPKGSYKKTAPKK